MNITPSPRAANSFSNQLGWWECELPSAAFCTLQRGVWKDRAQVLGRLLTCQSCLLICPDHHPWSLESSSGGRDFQG